MKNALLEVVWLLGCYALAVLVLGALVGYRQLLLMQTLDIQMHNTYFVLQLWLVTVPLFLFLATLITSMRAILLRFRQRATNLVLAGLGSVWLLLILLLLAGIWLSQKERLSHGYTPRRPGAVHRA